MILDIAGALDARLIEPIAESLWREPDALHETLGFLSKEAGDARLVIDGWSALESTEETYAVGHALDARLADLRAWVSEHAWIIADSAMKAPKGFETRSVKLDPDAPPAELQNGATAARPDLWERFSPDVGAYETALALIALDDGQDRAIPPAWKLREHVANRLPVAARELLYLAGIHARPLPEAVLAQLDASGPAQDLLVRLGLCQATAAGLVADPAWVAWCLEADDVPRTEYHLKLAKTFATLGNPEDASVDRAALAILEAHRHYLAAGDPESARLFARYGAAMLVEHGKRRSLAHDYMGAARLYQSVLELADRDQLRIGRRLHGYVRHYAHFNLAKAEAESLRDTERGYLESVMRWPDNALFRSRLIRTQIYRGTRGEALETLAAARREVPPHPEKEPALIARTVRGLLEPRHRGEFLVDALLVWDDYRPTTDFSREVGDTLEAALSAGWSMRVFDLPEVAPIWFFEPQRLRISRSADFWFAELPDLHCDRRGRSPKDALIHLVRGLREEVDQLIRAFTHSLGPETRMRKQVLLGVVDVIASRLDAPALERVWLVGDLQRAEDQTPYFVTNGSHVHRFELSPGLQDTVVVNDVPYLAQVVTGPSGVPTGPILSLEPAYGSAETVLEAWLAKAHDGG
ncbi:MAG TPA: hypothetical protein VH165_25315 [Kofleriaceae bacterium]|nr:hypothetical protein [Kofleriaceae bacterium]